MGNLTLARLLDDPIPEFRYCARCGVGMLEGREEPKCLDCVGLNRFKGSYRQTGPVKFPHNDPAYEVSLHYKVWPRDCPTVATLNALLIPHVIYTAKEDAYEVEWAKNLLNPELPTQWPIVLISAHGQYVEHWSGYNLQALNAIPAAREAATATNRAHHTERELIAA